MAAAPTVLVIAPHPDDEVLGCGGSILLHTDAGLVVHVLYLTSGERGSPCHTAGELRKVREAEATAAAWVLGISASRLHFARFPDGMAGSRNFPEWGTEPHWVPTVLGYEAWVLAVIPVTMGGRSASSGGERWSTPRAVNNLALQALVAAFATSKTIVDETSTRTAIAEVTTE